jgi:hypothetical protein
MADTGAELSSTSNVRDLLSKFGNFLNKLDDEIDEAEREDSEEGEQDPALPVATTPSPDAAITNAHNKQKEVRATRKEYEAAVRLEYEHKLKEVEQRAKKQGIETDVPAVKAKVDSSVDDASAECKSRQNLARMAAMERVREQLSAIAQEKEQAMKSAKDEAMVQTLKAIRDGSSAEAAEKVAEGAMAQKLAAEAEAHANAIRAITDLQTTIQVEWRAEHTSALVKAKKLIDDVFENAEEEYGLEAVSAFLPLLISDPFLFSAHPTFCACAACAGATWVH